MLMQKGEKKEEALNHHKYTGSGLMDSYFRELVYTPIDELVQLQIDYGLMTKDQFRKLWTDLQQLAGFIDLVVEIKRILVFELYKYATEMECMDHWFNKYGEELIRTVNEEGMLRALSQNVADKDQK
jgi:hypothetical protein